MNYTITAYSDIKKTKVEYVIIFDAVINGSETYSNEITAFTIEDGGFINDHVVKNKDKINIEGVISDLSFNQGESGLATFNFFGGIDYDETTSFSQEVKKKLRDINERSLPCAIKTSYKENGREVIDSDIFPCLIETMDLSNSGGQYGFIQPKITFVPVRIASIEFTSLTAEQQAIPALKSEAEIKRETAKRLSGSTGSTGGSGNGGSTGSSNEVPLDLTKTPEQASTDGLISKVSQAAKTFGTNVSNTLDSLEAYRDKLKQEAMSRAN